MLLRLANRRSDLKSIEYVFLFVFRLPRLLKQNSLNAFRISISLLFCVTTFSCNRGIAPNVLRFSHFWSEPGQRAVMDSVIADFKKENPDIQVEVSELSWSDGKTKLMINFNAETAPDVIEFGSDWIPEFSASSVLEDLSNMALLKSRFDSTPEYSRAPGIWQNKSYALPWFVDTRVLFVNRNLVTKAVGADSNYVSLTSWDKMYQLGEKINILTDVKGIGVNGSDAHRLYKKLLPQFWSNGGEILDRNGKPSFATKENIEALTFYVKQLNVGVLETQKNLDDLFKRGKLGILYSGAWLLKPLAKADFQWYCAPFPGNNGHLGVSFAGGEYLSINAHSSMKSQAEKLLAFLSRPDNELRLAKAFNIFPADRSLQQDSFYLNRNQGNILIEQLKNARMTPVHPKWLEIEMILEDEVAQALYKRKTPVEAMRSADSRVTELIAEP